MKTEEIIKEQLNSLMEKMTHKTAEILHLISTKIKNKEAILDNEVDEANSFVDTMKGKIYALIWVLEINKEPLA